MKTLIKNVAKLLAVIAITSLSTYLYAKAQSEPEIITNIIKQDVEFPPILKKIAQCESGNSHYDKNGQVLINKTLDVGKYQINSIHWGKKATELGLNLFNEKDNEQMALWIYYNRGTEDWSASVNCWKK